MKKRVNEIKNKLLQDESIALICKYILRPSYWMKKINMFFWLQLHVLTRHKIVRSFEDLFYSPNGFDLHSIVMIFLLGSIFLGFSDDIKMFQEMAFSLINLIKRSLEEIRELEMECLELETENGSD